MEYKDNIHTRVEDAVGSVASGENSNSGRIRRFYTNNYKSLDQFDQLWYECRYDKRENNWQTNYTWAIILDCVINARSAYCENQRIIEPLKDFIRSLHSEILEYVKGL